MAPATIVGIPVLRASQRLDNLFRQESDPGLVFTCTVVSGAYTTFHDWIVAIKVAKQDLLQGSYSLATIWFQRWDFLKCIS